MKALKILLIAAVLFIVIFLIVGLIAPKEQTIQQSTVIKAPAAAIFSHIRYMDKMAKWHPFLKKDAKVLISVQGDDGESGAIRFWKSDVGVVGEGFDQIVQMEAPHQMISTIKTVAPRTSEAKSTFSLEELSQGTRVIWNFNYSVPYPFNAFLLFTNDSDEQKKFFAEGLMGLKNTLERFDRTKVNYSLTEMDYEGGLFLYKKVKTPIDQVDLYVRRTAAELSNFRDKAGLKKSGVPTGFILSWNDQDVVEYALGIPITDKKDIPEGLIMEVPPRKSCKAVYINDLFSDKKKAHIGIQSKLSKEKMSYEFPIIEEFKKINMDENSRSAESVRIIYQVNY